MVQLPDPVQPFKHLTQKVTEGFKQIRLSRSPKENEMEEMIDRLVNNKTNH